MMQWVEWVALLQGHRFNPELKSVCMEFFVPIVFCAGFLWLLCFPPTVQKLSMSVGELATHNSPWLSPSVRICVWMMWCDRLVSHPEYIPASCPAFPGYTPDSAMTQPRTRRLLKMNECIFVSHSTYSVLMLDQFKAKSLHGFVTIDFSPFICCYE